jgi:chemotaxis protein CheD
MNHFLLPENDASEGLVSLRYGAFAMELLVNGLIRLGARRERMEAKLFGGARLSDGLPDMGGKNAAFAQEFLDRERIRHRGGSLRGDLARRVQFWPVSGRVRQLTLARGETLHFARAPETARDDDGTVEFFAARADRPG